MRRRRNGIVLAVSLAAHVALLAAWLNTQPRLHFVEPPIMEVQLVRAPPRPPEPQPPRPSPRQPLRLHRPAEPPAITSAPLPLPPAAPAPPQISPEWRVNPAKAWSGSGLPFTAQRAIRPPPCKSSRDHSDRPGDPCPSWSAEEQASHYDVAKDPKTTGFAYEGERKAALRDYREKAGKPGPGPADASDYPGLRCTLFHKHC